MRSILQGVLRELETLKRPEYTQALSSSVGTDSSISRGILEKSLHVIKLSEVSKYLKEAVPGIPSSSIVKFYELLKEMRGPKGYIDIPGEDAFFIADASTSHYHNVSKQLIELYKTGTIKHPSPKLQLLDFNGYAAVKLMQDKAKAYIQSNNSMPSTLKTFADIDQDVGHSSLSSNITFLLNTFVVNGIAGVELENRAESLSNLYNWLDANGKSKLLTTYANFQITKKKNLDYYKRIYEYIHFNQLNLLRKFKNGKGMVQFNLSGENIVDKLTAQLKNDIAITITEVAPQGSSFNNDLANKVESLLKVQIPIYYERALALVERQIVEHVKKNLNIAELEGSRSLKQMVADSFKEDIIEQLSSKKIKRKPTTESTKVTSGTTKKKTKVSAVLPKSGAGKITSRVTPPRLRTIKGQFTSVTSLEVLMRASLRETVIKNMQRPNLRNQTGRFAESVELKSLSRARDGAITAFLTYMRHPYSTFEKSGKQGFRGYYPSRLIDTSVREIASKLVRERMRVVVQ